jgi:hypothetical protein
MSLTQIVVAGTVKPDGTLELDEKLGLAPGRGRVILPPVGKVGEPGATLLEVLEQIWKDQEARGFKGRSKEEIDADLAAMRAEEEEYEERWRQIYAQTPTPLPEEKPPC